MTHSPALMAISVRVFARARDAAGCGVIHARVPVGAVAGDVFDGLPKNVRDLVDQAATRLAVNGEWAAASHPLIAGDEVALITPVSGGA